MKPNDTELTKMYLQRGINKERIEAIKKYAGHSILDVGCGNGAYILELYKDYDIYGVDYQYYESWDTLSERFSISDATDLDYDDCSFDTILSFETLEHLTDPYKALDEYYRVSKKNIILTVPNCSLTSGMKESQLIYYHWIDRTHINFFDIESIQELIKKSGFKIIDLYFINQISLLPLFKESFGLKHLPNEILRKALNILQQKQYYLTCMIIGEKS